MERIAIVAPRIEVGGHIRIIVPSLPLSAVSPEVQEKASDRVTDFFGATISFGNVEATDVQSRYQDLLDAFKDDTVNAIFPATGGFNSNDILAFCHHNPKKGEELRQTIRTNPKIVIGASDNSMLTTAITSQTDLITYYGYHYANIGIPDDPKDVSFMMQ